MKESKVIMVKSIKKCDNIYEEYDVRRARTQADSLIKRMKEKLYSCYDETVEKLEDMDRMYQSTFSENISTVPQFYKNNEKIYDINNIESIINKIRDWRE